MKNKANTDSSIAHQVYLKIRGKEVLDKINQLKEAKITLNIYNCHFEATQEEVQETFKAFKFEKLHNYKPGAFSLEFDSKDEAIKFLYETKDLVFTS